MSKRRLVIVGNGMATCRLLDDLLARGALARYDITVIGEEPGGAYNRILLSKVLAGDAPDRIVTKPLGWYADAGIHFRNGTRAVRLDTVRKLVQLVDGDDLAYDVVVIATGSQAM